jgi:formate--tetrahydrofolate ligase
LHINEAETDLKKIYKNSYDKLPICMAKTQNSLSDNPKLIGRPKDFTLTIREIIISLVLVLVPLTGEIMRMPVYKSAISRINRHRQ